MNRLIPILALMPDLLGAGQAQAFTLTLDTYHETCGNANGAVLAITMNATPPINYTWSEGSTTDGIFDLLPGIYSVTVTDGTGAQQTAQTEVLAVSSLVRPVPLQVPQGGHFGCNGCGIGVHVVTVEPGTAYYWPNVEWPVTVSGASIMTEFGPGNAVYGPYCFDDPITMEFTDATGCSGTIALHEPYSYNVPGGFSVLDIIPACNGVNGSVTLDVNSGGSMATGWTIQMENAANGIVGYNNMPMTEQITFTAIPEGTYDVIRRVPDGWDYPGNCPAETLSVTVPDLGPFCGTVTGRVFFDHDQDCAFGATDDALPYTVLEIQPGPFHAITNADGTYATNLLFGSYTIAPVAGADLIPICPPETPAEFTIDALNTIIVQDLADSSALELDIAVDLTSGPARPGFVVSYAGWVRNLGGQLSGPLEVTLNFDPVLSFVSAQPAPTTVMGSTIIWSGVSGLGAFGSTDVHIQLQVPPDAGLLGTDLSATLAAVQPLPEADATNNQDLHAVEITGSYDPNVKTVRTSTGASDTFFFIDQDQWMDYTIHFQNTGTASAIDVAVTDTLSDELDMATFVQGVASHGFDVSFKPDRVVEWHFANINLPDSGANEAASHGSVSFRIYPQLPVLAGTVIANTANIYFDFNEPVITEPSVLTAEFSTGLAHAGAEQVLVVRPNPTNGTVWFQLPERCGRTVLEVFSVDGRLVAQSFAFGLIGEIDLHDLPPSVYMLRATCADGSAFNQRIIKH